jgi:diguanylate cyclase (GGDEF)-like protein
VRRPGDSPTALIVAEAALLVLAVAVVDYLTGVEYRTFPLYFIPVTLASIRLGKGAGIGTATASAAAWLVSNHLAGMDRAHAPLVATVNTGVMLITFVFVALLTSAQRDWLLKERALSRTDGLTGLRNGRGFYEAAESEIARAARYRHPLTVAYLDLDNFKTVNDRFGHARGDELLALVGRTLRHATRATDVVGRLGGDEFAVIFPESDRLAAAAALAKLKALLDASIAKRQCPVSVSIGAVSFATPPPDVETLVHEADRVMYEVKGAGKDDIRCVDAALAGPSAAPVFGASPARAPRSI